MYRVLFVTLLMCVVAGATGSQDCNGIGEAQFVCLSAGAEDLIALPNSDWIIASGELRAINVRDHSEVTLYSDTPKLDRSLYAACPGPIAGREVEEKKFRAHGINLRKGNGGVHTLYVVHHQGRESIEIFELDARPKAPTVSWVGCVAAPPGVSGNSVAVLPNSGFAVTNFATRTLGGYRGPEGANLRAMLSGGKVTGEVWEWSPAGGWKKVPGTEGAGPNGIEASPDGKSLYVAEWGSQKLLRISRAQTPVKKDAVSLDFHPDNLRWQADGSLVAGGQYGSVDEILDNCLGNRNCANTATSVAKIDPATLKVQELVHRYPANDQFAAGTSGVIVGSEVWVGSTSRGTRVARFALKSRRF
jgi:hypothetical protein